MDEQLHEGRWEPIPSDDPVYSDPSRQTPAPVMHNIRTLPTNLMDWEDFERLLVDISSEVEGLRDPRRYGRAGQAQGGLDVLATRVDGAIVAIQCKKYNGAFKASDLKDAVTTFREATRGFEITRLIIATSGDIADVKLEQELIAQKTDLSPIDLELWGPVEISARLRNKPVIVRRFFGDPTRESFCDEAISTPIPLPAEDVVQIRAAVRRTPEVATGARDLLNRASTLPANDALPLVEKAQDVLRRSGFPSHADALQTQRTSLLLELGRVDDAAREAIAELWNELDALGERGIQNIRGRLRQIQAKAPDSEVAKDALIVADNVAFLNGQASVGDLPSIAKLAIGNGYTRSRLGLLAGEVALAADDHKWLSESAKELSALIVNLAGDPMHRLRMQIIVADATGDWADLVQRARSGDVDCDDAGTALIFARYARKAALEEQFEVADSHWKQAADSATLVAKWSDAEAWTGSRRAFQILYKMPSGDELFPLQMAFRSRGPVPRIVPGYDGAHLQALEELRRGRSAHAAVVPGRRAVRDAVVRADWGAEDSARLVLGDALVAAGKLSDAAHQYAVAANSGGERMLETNPEQYVDNIQDLLAPNYWTAGSALQVVAQQGDLIPDEQVFHVVDAILVSLDRVKSKKPDHYLFHFSRFNGAIAAAASIALRIPAPAAEQILGFFTAQPSPGPNGYRMHDRDEAVTVAGIIMTHGSLADIAVKHLVDLLARSERARVSVTFEALEEYRYISLPLVHALASSGEAWAQTFITQGSDLHIEDSERVAAVERLSLPLIQSPGVMTVGNGALDDAVLASTATQKQLQSMIAEQLRRAADRLVSWPDKLEYLEAAAVLARNLEPGDREGLFAKAESLAYGSASSIVDDEDYAISLGSNNLGAIRDRAVYVAGILANTLEERERIRVAALSLLRGGDTSDKDPTRALAAVCELTYQDVAYLSGMGYYARAQAADTWVQLAVAKPAWAAPHIGLRLAADLHPAVRRTIAIAVSHAPVLKALAGVRDLLAGDQRHSVRRLVGNEKNKKSD